MRKFIKGIQYGGIRHGKPNLRRYQSVINQYDKTYPNPEPKTKTKPKPEP